MKKSIFTLVLLSVLFVSCTSERDEWDSQEENNFEYSETNPVQGLWKRIDLDDKVERIRVRFTEDFRRISYQYDFDNDEWVDNTSDFKRYEIVDDHIEWKYGKMVYRVDFEIVNHVLTLTEVDDIGYTKVEKYKRIE